MMHIANCSIAVLIFAIVNVIGRETVYQAAVIARALVEGSGIGTMATVDANFQPFALQEYYAPCYRNGSLALLFLPISRHSRNILQANVNVSITIASQHPSASRARVSLLGPVHVFSNNTVIPDEHSIRRCYLNKHSDAKWWLPHDDHAAHTSYWARLDPQEIYFVGGFGDNHYIGQIPVQIYQQATPPHLSYSLKEQVSRDTTL